MVTPSTNQRGSIFLKRLTTICIGITLCISIMGLSGRIIEIPVLASFSPDYIPIAISTCAGFLLQGIILIWRVHYHSRTFRSPIELMVVITIILGVFGVIWGWIPKGLPIKAVSPLLLSPLTGALFIFSGAALLLLIRSGGNKAAIYLAISLAATVLITGLVVALSYVYANPLLYHATVVPMALTTSLAFTFLGIGLITATGPDGPLLDLLTGSSIHAMLLRIFVPLGFVGIILSDILQHFITRLNSAIVSGASVVIIGAITVAIVIKASRVISNIVETADAKRREAEELLRRDKEYWENTFNTVPDLIAILDCEHRVIRANKAMANRLGCTPRQCEGGRCYQLFHGTDEPIEGCPHTLSCSDGKEHVFEAHLPHLGGYFLVSTTPKPDVNGFMTSIHVARDITERKEMELEREKLVAELQEALSNVKTLSGLFPICASCKKIRDDTGYWQQIEAYIHDHSEANFSHSMCPDCAKKMYADLFEDEPELFEKLFPGSSEK